jgi:CRISPR-associated protein Csx14
VLTPIGGSFNFDPRGAWTAMDAGYSPNTQKHGVAASPLVHLLAACGLEHTRPVEFGIRQVRYCAWSGLLPVSLARVALQGGSPSLPTKQFRFELALSGKNKIVTFAQQENAHEYR